MEHSAWSSLFCFTFKFASVFFLQKERTLCMLLSSRESCTLSQRLFIHSHDPGTMGTRPKSELNGFSWPQGAETTPADWDSIETLSWPHLLFSVCVTEISTRSKAPLNPETSPWHCPNWLFICQGGRKPHCGAIFLPSLEHAPRQCFP